MAVNLLDSVKGLFTGDLVQQVSSMFGEKESNVEKAISGAIPASLTGILNKASTTGGAMDLLEMSREASRSGILGNVMGMLKGGAMGNILNMAGGLFGDKLSGITRMIANFAGIKESSAASIVDMTTPAALATIGKEATASNMSTSGLVSMLNNQKDSILGAVPSGLNIAGALGLGSLGELGSKLSNAAAGLFGAAKGSANSARQMVETTERKNKWALPLLLGLLAVLALWYFLGKKPKEPEVAMVSPDSVTIAEPAVTQPVTESYKVKLWNGTEIDAMKGGIEDRLVTFLDGSWKSLSADSMKKIWFDFDNINFETGSAQLTAASMKQIDNLALIMKTYADAKFKVGGYTDKVGNDADNKKLSQQRADAVAAALKKAGAPASSIAGAEGYGEEYATVDESASDEARRVDRRMALSVRK